MGEKIQLGSKVKDRITGFTGTATGRAEYLFDPAAVRVEAPQVEGRDQDKWIPESRLEVIG
jgi:hypothetical protein